MFKSIKQERFPSEDQKLQGISDSESRGKYRGEVSEGTGPNKGAWQYPRNVSLLSWIQEKRESSIYLG